MSANLELRWLKIDELTGAARRFAEFSKEDIKEQGKEENFDVKKYEAGVKLVLGKLDNSLLLKKLFNPTLGEELEQVIDAVDTNKVKKVNEVKENELEETNNAN